MSDPAKVRRHAERVRELVASAVRTQIKDPRLGMITITDARITADLREATVFYTVLGDAEAKAGTAAALESGKGLLRSVVGKALGIRHSPSLTFVLDDVQEHVKHIDDLIAEARLRDEQVQKLAEGAEYAGEPQPYKVEDEFDGEFDDEEFDENAEDTEDEESDSPAAARR
ncbi:MAG: 30S ribosome-binding factor RbfA [Catenulispora sp.]|nr:30S ribosome-binding factor RbfA [Catenulispora sp.]